MTLLGKVGAWVARNGVPRAGEAVVVGCSGGGDSTALLVALRALGLGPLHAVYVDHGLRDGTDGEARLVAELAAAHGAGFARAAVVVERSGNLLANARAARYRALAERALAVGARLVAVGHTATDQAETVVFRAARGDVAHALAGMPARRPLDGAVELVRPLLDVTRDDAAAFVAARGLRAVADPTNERDDLTRTRIRRRLAPLDATADLCRLAGATDAWVAELDARAAALGPLDALDAAAIAAGGPDLALRLLRRAGLHRAGRAHARALLALAADCAGTRRIDLGGGLVAERRYREMRLGPPGAGDPGDVAVPVAGAGRYRLLGSEIVLAPEGAGDRLAVAALTPPLILRNVRPGDRVQSAVGHRKLKELLIDRKVPRDARRRLPLLAAAGSIVWVAGLGACHGARPARGAPSLAITVVDSPSTYAIMK